jgi:hypothetical protein
MWSFRSFRMWGRPFTKWCNIRLVTRWLVHHPPTVHRSPGEAVKCHMKVKTLPKKFLHLWRIYSILNQLTLSECNEFERSKCKWKKGQIHCTFEKKNRALRKAKIVTIFFNSWLQNPGRTWGYVWSRRIQWTCKRRVLQVPWKEMSLLATGIFTLQLNSRKPYYSFYNELTLLVFTSYAT